MTFRANLKQHWFIRKGALWLACVALTAATLSAADDKDPKDKKDSLPLHKVVLFSSGVGFYQHAGEVDGNAKVDLKFNVAEVNDLLKSMVLEDLDGGKISTVTYGSKDPINKTLKTFAIDLTSNPTMGDLLQQIRGEKVQVDAPQPIIGTILGVEKRKQKAGKDETIEVEYLNLSTADGLRSINLETASRIKLIDEKLNAELQKALTILAASHSTDKKTVTLNFLGDGKRHVRVGYIEESPIWKTSYRLMIKDKEPLFLQGWAIVENTTEQDWHDVKLSLISGRPVSFVMDLYQPLYVARPLVQQELYASLRPQIYGQDLSGRDRDFRRMAEGKGLGGMGGGGGFALPAGSPAAAAPALARSGSAKADNSLRENNKDAAMDFSHGAASLAQAGDVGEMFQYEIEAPVSLPRQESAMLSIVNERIKGEKLSIYNQQVQTKHPMSGLKLVNSTKLHLMQGPITVFDGDVYAGDARIEDLQPGTERLISYALDLDTEVAPETKPLPEQLVEVKLVKGTLQTSRKLSRETKYVIKNSGKHDKKVLVEVPHDPNWNLVEPKEPTEKTRDLYRFAVQAEPGKPSTLTVREEQTVSQQMAVSNLDEGTIVFYMNSKVISPEAKAALAEVIKRKQAIQVTAQKKGNLQQQVSVVDQEQSRIRQNMAQLERNSDLYNRYVKKFGEQEDQVEKLRKDIQGLNEEEQKQRRDLDDYLSKLDL
ncbi:MAG TPA: hypothetical protein VFE24_13665 [Pirellulales bacterium]|jgi:hypothetical protein|nr:hypothetical protein [Pirellulales bacterium]